MLVRHTNRTLQRIDDDPEYNGRLGLNVASAFQTLMLNIRAADNENDLRAMKSLHFEKLKGKRQHEYSMRVNKQFRLIFQIEKVDRRNQLVITDLEDDHS
jgi:proteic killer suppression protein